jgi:hypothetical protein
VTDRTEDRSAAAASTAKHLAELDARYDTHLAALRKTAADVQAGVAHGADVLADAVPTDANDNDPADP